MHPTKHEVRFRDGRMVHDFLYGTLHRALGDVRPEDQLAAPVATAIVRPTGLEAGEFGPQGEMRLAANALLKQPQAQPRSIRRTGLWDLVRVISINTPRDLSPTVPAG